MLELKIIIASVIVSFAYSIMIRQGELLQVWARFLNRWNDLNDTTFTRFITKLLLCPYCWAGQISLWSCLFVTINLGSGFEVFITVPFSIVTMWFLSNEYLKNE